MKQKYESSLFKLIAKWQAGTFFLNLDCPELAGTPEWEESSI